MRSLLLSRPRHRGGTRCAQWSGNLVAWPWNMPTGSILTHPRAKAEFSVSDSRPTGAIPVCWHGHALLIADDWKTSFGEVVDECGRELMSTITRGNIILGGTIRNLVCGLPDERGDCAHSRCEMGQNGRLPTVHLRRTIFTFIWICVAEFAPCRLPQKGLCTMEYAMLLAWVFLHPEEVLDGPVGSPRCPLAGCEPPILLVECFARLAADLGDDCSRMPVPGPWRLSKR